MMNRTTTTALASGLMQDFAAMTGLDPAGARPKRYLWTDAFAVCNYCGLFMETGNPAYRELALRLADQVHHTLGRHRGDDTRTGWISGLPAEEGEKHPTAGGLRIGKSLPERGEGEPFSEQQEWDRDGQYYHYLTRWMHALSRLGGVTGNPAYGVWAIELARTAHARFTYRPPAGGRKRMYWKMSIDLSRPLVPSMGQHDPLDGLVTYRELQRAAARNSGLPHQPVLAEETADMTGILQIMHLATADPLGIGGLLCDAVRIARISVQGDTAWAGLPETVLGSALAGLDAFAASGPPELPARYRLAFRELGLSIGLAGAQALPELVAKNPDLSGRADGILQQVQALQKYVPLRERIEQFWLEGRNREAVTWTEHREINTVMLATSLAPDGYLGI